MRLSCSLDPDEDSIYHFKGRVYKWQPNIANSADQHSSVLLFGFEGFSVGRCEKIEEGKFQGGFQQYSRELVFFTDPSTGEILEEWTNSKGDVVEVCVCCVCVCVRVCIDSRVMEEWTFSQGDVVEMCVCVCVCVVRCVVCHVLCCVCVIVCVLLCV
jgi:hypothetical protein